MLTWIRGLWQSRSVNVPQIDVDAPAITAQESIRVAASLPLPPVKRTKSPQDESNCPIRQAGLGNAKQRIRLRQLGLTTLEQIAACEPSDWADKHSLPAVYQRLLVRWQWAIAASSKLPPLRPIDCLLAHAVHRRTIGAIARSVPSVLHRDIYRFSLSSAGAKLVGEHPLPSQNEIEIWVAAARNKLPLPYSPR